jgi:large subunit ribosomal protein L30e
VEVKRREVKMIDADKILKNAVKNGKVKIGAKQTKLAVKDGSAKLIIISKNCPFSSEISTLADKKKVPVYNYESSSINLGFTCGKNYAVSAFAVLDDGGSNIMNLVKKK